MKRLYIITIRLVFWIPLFYTSSCLAQENKSWQWVLQLGGSSWEKTSGLACDSKNNIYMVGNFLNNLIYNKEEVRSTGNQDFFIARINEDGKIKNLWQGGGKHLDEVTCVGVLEDNKIVFGGAASDTIIILPKIRTTG